MNIVRIYNQNRKKIWKAILIVAFFIIIFQAINYYVGKSNEEEIERLMNGTNSLPTNTSNNNANNNSSSMAISNTSGISGGTVSDENLENAQSLLDKFFGYCNSRNLSEAYNMLTDECKELIYPSLELFESNYYNNIFNGEQKIYSFENWRNNTYLVTIEENSLATGKVSSDTEKKVDYVTIVDDKLNISTFIGRTTINKTTTSNGITVVVNSKDTYMDYETYNITVTNNTGKTICLASLDSSDNIYLLDDNDIKYGVYNHELLQSSLVLKNYYSEEYSLKFYSSYVSTKKIEGLVFSSVYMDYENNENDTYTLYVNV